MNNFSFFPNLCWRRYLLLLFVLLGVGFFSSGIITWIAANWSGLSKFEKIYLIQGSVLLSGITTILCYLYQSKKPKPFILSVNIFSFITAILTGGLLALIGQVYQTGAVPWELFALWSLLQLPLLLLYPNIASVMLIMLTSNTALCLYLVLTLSPIDFHYIFLGLTIFNLAWLFINERYFTLWQDQHWHITPRISHFLVATSLLIFTSSSEQWWLIVNLLAVAYFYYYTTKKRVDMITCIIWLFFLIASVNFFILRHISDHISTMLFLSLMNFGYALFLIRHIKKIFPHSWHIKSLPWLLQLLLIFLVLISVITCLVFVTDIFNIDHEKIILPSGIVCLLLGLVGYYRQYFVQTSLLLLVCGLLLIQGNHLLQDNTFSLMIVLSICGILLAMLNHHWIMLICSTFFFVNLRLHWQLNHELNNDNFIAWIPMLHILLPLIFAYGQYKIELNPLKDKLNSLFWGALLSAVGFIFMTAIFGFYPINRYDFAYDNEEIPHFIHRVTLYFWVGEFTFSHLLCLLITFSPVILTVLLGITRILNPCQSISLMVILTLFGLSFASHSFIPFCLSLLLFAYVQRHRGLFLLALFSFISSLCYYYYSLDVLLIDKAYLLLVTGVLLTGLSILLKDYREQHTVDTESNDESKLHLINPHRNRYTVGFGIAILLILGIANTSVYRYESILKHGQSVLLELAPVDPRSLMQGDYMILNYQLVEQVRKKLTESLEYPRIYAHLKLDHENLATLCEVTFDNRPSEPCKNSYSITMKRNNYWDFSMPGQAFFFEEGLGKHYEQARYAEFKIKGNKVLIYRLLDENKKVL